MQQRSSPLNTDTPNPDADGTETTVQTSVVSAVSAAADHPGTTHKPLAGHETAVEQVSAKVPLGKQRSWPVITLGIF